MSSASTPLSELDVISASRYAEHGYPHLAWKRLRAEAPVHFVERQHGRPFWAVTRHEDITRISRDPRGPPGGQIQIHKVPPRFQLGTVYHLLSGLHRRRGEIVLLEEGLMLERKAGGASSRPSMAPSWGGLN